MSEVPAHKRLESGLRGLYRELSIDLFVEVSFGTGARIRKPQIGLMQLRIPRPH